jgi:hypothetical protein
MSYTEEQIVAELCNEYKALFTRETFDPASDLSYEDYRKNMLNKTLPELIKETSTDSEYYTLDTYMKKYGDSLN